MELRQSVTYMALFKGLVPSNAAYGTRPTIMVHIATYRHIEMTNDIIVAKGTDREGFFASCVIVETHSNPT